MIVPPKHNEYVFTCGCWVFICDFVVDECSSECACCNAVCGFVVCHAFCMLRFLMVANATCELCVIHFCAELFSCGFDLLMCVKCTCFVFVLFVCLKCTYDLVCSECVNVVFAKCICRCCVCELEFPVLCANLIF